jgi:hypothetical protein
VPSLRRPKTRRAFDQPVDFDSPQEAGGWEHFKELVGQRFQPGSDDISSLMRCRTCSHLEGAHSLRGCEAHRCPCKAYEPDERYRLPPAGSIPLVQSIVTLDPPAVS